MAGLFVLQLYLIIAWQLRAVYPNNEGVQLQSEPNVLSTFIVPYSPLDTLQNKDIFGGIQARAFEERINLSFPCLAPDPKWRSPQTHRSPTHDGFLMIKELKTGGSTAAGIHLRIARNVARRNTQYQICKVRNDHADASKMHYRFRNRTRSFLWTVVRDPTKRAISQFFHFQVSRKMVEPTDENFKKWIQECQTLYRYYLRTLSVDSADVNSPDYDPVLVANKIFQDYDFIGVTERMDESAVALQLLLGLNTGDILYTSAKGSGTYEAVPDAGCVYIHKSFVSEGMQQYFDSIPWKVMIASDEFFHKAANRSLDLTIEKLGKDRFDTALRSFRHAMLQVEVRCQSQIQFPCTSSGEEVRDPCLWMDSGCGTECLDEVAQNLEFANPT